VIADVDVWVGSGYVAAERRVLILGESWWGDVERLGGAIERWARDEQADATFSRLFNTCSGKRRERASYNERMAFWNSIAFYNFVQGSLGATRKSRPSRMHFTSAIPALEKVLKSLKPTCVWVVGVGQSEYSSAVLQQLNIPFEVVRHPSSGISHENFYGSWRNLLARVS
jgi:hypothetical protein